MPKQDFSIFLKRYLIEHSSTGTISVCKLADEAAYDTPELREALFLYSVYTGQIEKMLRAAAVSGLSVYYAPVLLYCDRADLENALKSGHGLPDEYHNLWINFINR